MGGIAESRRTPHVLIVGAGLTGLFVAHGLKKAGIAYTIFEAEQPNDSRRREWSMGIHWGVPLMESLLPPELSARVIAEATVDPTLDYVTPPTNGSKIYDGVTGDVLKVLESEGKLLRASRRKLRKLISEGIDVKFGHQLANITYHADNTVTAHFSNHASYTGTVLLGVDGARSVTRSLLFSPSPAPARNVPDVIQLSTVFSFHDAAKARFVRSAHPVWSMMLHPEAFVYLCVQDAPDPEAPENWQFFVFFCWRGVRDDTLTNAQRIALVQSRARESRTPMMEPFRSLIEWLPAEIELPYIDLGYWIAEPWDARGGRATLAGDAAHPMPPFRGQGLNHALQDAVNFVQVMEKIRDGDSAGQAALIKAYGDEVAARGAEETKLTLRNGQMLVSYDDAKESPYFQQGLSRGGSKCG